jgi:manganese/zinc/iron transport system substrate-binding protein
MMRVSNHDRFNVTTLTRRRFAATAVAAIGAAATTGRYPVHADDGHLDIAATTGQVGDLLRNVGGDRVSVTALMGPGVDPHLYKASEQDVITLIDSDAIFYQGLHLEGKLGEVLEQLGTRRPVTAVGDGIPHDLLTTPEGFDGNPDPHVWFDPNLWSYCADAAATALGEIDPDGVAIHTENASSYKDQLAELHSWALGELGTIPDQQRVLVTAHDAFGYFGRAYDIEVVGLQGISTSTEAGIRDVQRIADLLAERHIPTIFVETSVPRRTIEAVQVAARDRGWEVSIGTPLYSDALGDSDSPEGTYLGMFRYNVQAIVEGLKG